MIASQNRLSYAEPKYRKVLFVAIKIRFEVSTRQGCDDYVPKYVTQQKHFMTKPV